MVVVGCGGYWVLLGAAWSGLGVRCSVLGGRWSVLCGGWSAVGDRLLWLVVVVVMVVGSGWLVGLLAVVVGVVVVGGGGLGVGGGGGVVALVVLVLVLAGSIHNHGVYFLWARGADREQDHLGYKARGCFARSFMVQSKGHAQQGSFRVQSRGLACKIF